MNKSDSIKELAVALVKAQGKIKKAVKDSSNPAFVRSGVISKYADLESVMEACQEALNENGLAVIQTFETHLEGNVAFSYLETTLAHQSGEWITGRQLLIPVKDDPQGLASASTYARRYGLAAMVGVVQTDDDGNAASGKWADGKPIAPDPPKKEEPKPEVPIKPVKNNGEGKKAEVIVSESGDMATIVGWLDNAIPRKDKKQRDYLILTIDDMSVSCFDNKLWSAVKSYKGQDVKAFVDMKKIGDRTYYNLISIVPLHSIGGIPMKEPPMNTNGPWDGEVVTDKDLPF